MVGDDTAGATQGQLQPTAQAGAVDSRYRGKRQLGNPAENTLPQPTGLGGLLRILKTEKFLDIYTHYEVVRLTADPSHSSHPSGIVALPHILIVAVAVSSPEETASAS